MKSFGVILSAVMLLCIYVTTAKGEKADTLTREEKIAEWKRINEQVWKPFSEAYLQLDAQRYLDLHAVDFLRIGDGRILTKQQYTEQQIRNFQRYKQQGITLAIDFRLVERIVNENFASERGIFCTIAHKGTPKEQRYYGKFHVIMRKEQSTWKITMDYDSDERGTINAKSFEEAFALEEFAKL